MVFIMKSEMTLIRIKKETVEILKNLGKKGDTYDDVIRKLIEAYKKCQKTKT